MGRALIGVEYRDRWQEGSDPAWRPDSKQRAGIKLGVRLFEESGRLTRCRWIDGDDLKQEALIAVWQEEAAAGKDLSRFTTAKNRARWALLTMAQYLVGDVRGLECEIDAAALESHLAEPDLATPEALARLADAWHVLQRLPPAMVQALEWQQEDVDVATQAKAAGVNPQVAWHRIRNVRSKLEAVL